MTDSTGVYISVPFCRAKCTYCNFASGVFGAERMDRYVDALAAEIAGVRIATERMGAGLPRRVDTIFFGGGTPSLLSAEQMRRVFGALRGEFDVAADAEVTLECAPGQLGGETLDEMLRQGMNRISFGVQSFVDAESRAVGRMHTREMCLAEIERIRAAGVSNINVDLIAGLPGQTAESWRESVEVALESGVPHVSVYMLEVDEDSRLGREVLASGNKYGAGVVPTEDETAEWYGAACGWLDAGGVRQYEISNFAREKVRGQGKDKYGDSDSSSQNDAFRWGAGNGTRGGAEDGNDYRSRHNVKYWRRENYLGFGLDAHSMLRTGVGGVRWANGDDLDGYLGLQGQGVGRQGSVELVQLGVGAGPEVEGISKEKAFEETMFLGLRMNEGVDMETLRTEFGEELMRVAVATLGDVEEAGLVVVEVGKVRLTARGRMASNEVFGRLLVGKRFEMACATATVEVETNTGILRLRLRMTRKNVCARNGTPKM